MFLSYIDPDLWLVQTKVECAAKVYIYNFHEGSKIKALFWKSFKTVKSDVKFY